MKRALQYAAALAVCAALLCPAARAAGYADVPAGAWYEEAANVCREKGLMSGTDGENFSPGLPATRAMLAAVLYRLDGSPAPAEGEGDPFPDVRAGDWYAPAAAWAAREGVMLGRADGRFAPGAPVTRQQLAAVFWRWRGSPAASAADFADAADISPYAAAAVDWTRSTGLMRGRSDNRFNPAATLTRAQLAQVLANYCASGLAAGVSAIDVMCQPCGLAVMGDGSLLVTDRYNKMIWRVAEGESALFAGAVTAEDPYGQPMGGYHDGSLPASLFKDPWAIAPFLGGWAVSDPENGVVRFLRPDAAAGRWKDVTDLGLRFDHPTGLAADGEGNLYVAETFQGAVKKITPAGSMTTLASNLAEPMGLCWANGSLYAAECGGNRILKISGSGQVSAVAGSGDNGSADGSAAEASFSGPKGVAVAGDGTVYVADTDNGAVRRVQNGRVTTLLSRAPGDVTALFPAAPTGLLLQGDTLYIADTFARKLLALPLR